MKRVLKVLGGFAGVIAVAVVGILIWSAIAAEARLAQTWPEVEGEDLIVPSPLTETELETLREALRAEGFAHDGTALTARVAEDGSERLPDPLEGADLDAIALERALERGAHLYNVRLGCGECHGANLGGGLIADAQPVWTWYAPNISSGGVTHAYTTTDWDRIIRHGVKKDGTNATMPAVDYMALSDREVSDIIAYARHQPAVDDVQPETSLGPLGRILLATGAMPIAAEQIDHTSETRDAPPEAEVSVAYGQHIAQPCVGCHRLQFEGGPIAAGPPEWPPAANLTRNAIKQWSEEDFLAAMRTGVRPDGSTLDPVAMPWRLIGRMTDVELRAIWMYLQTLETVETGT